MNNYSRSAERFWNFKFVPAFKLPCFFITDFSKKEGTAFTGGYAQGSIFELACRSPRTVRSNYNNIFSLEISLDGTLIAAR